MVTGCHLANRPKYATNVPVLDRKGPYMADIKINGTIRGNRSVVISGNKVIVDGVDVTPDSKEIIISVTGDIAELTVDSCDRLLVTGNVTTLKTSSGDVEIRGNVIGSVTTEDGDVEIGGDVGGDITTKGGDVECGGSVHGSVTTRSGDISHG